jgi:shikimate dehydrogenase
MDEGESWMGIRKFAVLGNPVEHSLSPTIHQAAYDALGLDWHYSRIQVDEQQLATFLDARMSEFAGFSLTMPLKDELFKIAGQRGWQVDNAALLLGSANTLVVGADGLASVANTDLVGAKRALKDLPASISSLALLGSGATARTLSLAVLQTFPNLDTITVFSRRPEPAQSIAGLVEQFSGSVKFEWLPLEAAADFGGADLTVNTLPSTVSKTVEIDLPFSESFVFDVTYDNATDSPATNWQVENRVDGRTMLVFQAVEQLRLFGAFEAAVLDVTEEDVANAMFASIL